jgi:hypothetical protein
MKLAPGVILLGGMLAAGAAHGQDAATSAMQAAQQATDAAMQANQQAIAQMQRDSDQAAAQAQRNMDEAQRNAQQAAPILSMTQQPKFSADSGRVAGGTLLRLTCPTHYAVIYYTTDGWTPTTASTRYTGPIEIGRDTTIQAIAIAPNMAKSFVARAEYQVAGSRPEGVQPLATDGVLRAGTPLQMSTAAALDSKTARVGDKLPLRLDQDVMVGDRVAIAKGTVVEATITQADPAGHVGVPGDLVFEVRELVADGIKVPLQGGETLEGPNRYKKTIGILLVPVVGVAGLATKGGQAAIQPGMPVTVSVKSDTPLTPTASR